MCYKYILDDFMTAELQLKKELNEKLEKLLTNLNNDAEKPWVSKPASRLALAGLLLTGLGFSFTVWQYTEKASEVALRQGEINKQNMAATAQNFKLIEVNEQVRQAEVQLKDLKNQQGNVDEQLNQKREEISKLVAKFGPLTEYVLGEELTTYAILDSLTPGIIVTKNIGIFKGGEYTVSAFVDYPSRFEKDILSRIESVKTIPSRFKLEDGSTLNVGSPVRMNELFSERYKQRFTSSYSGDYPITKFAMEFELKNLPPKNGTTCYVVSYPPKTIDRDNLLTCEEYK